MTGQEKFDLTLAVVSVVAVFVTVLVVRSYVL